MRPVAHIEWVIACPSHRPGTYGVAVHFNEVLAQHCAKCAPSLGVGVDVFAQAGSAEESVDRSPGRNDVLELSVPRCRRASRGENLFSVVEYLDRFAEPLD